MQSLNTRTRQTALSLELISVEFTPPLKVNAAKCVAQSTDESCDCQSDTNYLGQHSNYTEESCVHYSIVI